MSDTITTVLSAALVAAMAALIAYQVYMLRWTKRTTGTLPRVVVALRTINIVALLAGTGAIIWALAR